MILKTVVLMAVVAHTHAGEEHGDIYARSLLRHWALVLSTVRENFGMIGQDALIRFISLKLK